MATKQMANREPQYDEANLDPDLVSVAEVEARERGKVIARLRLLWEQRQILYRWAAIGLIASIIIALLIPVRYTSTVRLMPPDQSQQGVASMLAALGKTGGGGGGDIGSIGGELLGLKTSADMFVGVLHSRTVEDDLINKFDLRKVYGRRRYSDTRKELDERTDVVADRKSGIITLKVSDRSPDRAAALGLEYVEALNRMVVTLNTSSAHKEKVFLEERLGQVQQELESAEKDFSQYASQNTTIDVKEQGKAMIGAAADLEGQLMAAQTQLEGLRQIYAPGNVRIRSVQARIEEYRRQLQKLGGKSGGSAAGETPHNSDSTELGQDSYPTIRQLPILGVRWADLYRRSRVEEAVFETLTKQYELAKVEEARETPSVKVLDQADVPEEKSYPPRILVILLGTAFVCILGSVWVLTHARWQEVDPRDPKKILAEEIIGTIRTNMNNARKNGPWEHSGGRSRSQSSGPMHDLGKEKQDESGSDQRSNS
jgi:capsule polysaccharide export protein KpsE/RkpR